MPEKLDAGPATVDEMFDGFKEYASPLFQRQYVWGKIEIDNLWRNIDDIIEGTESSRFLGAIVLENRQSGKAFRPEENWVVDGQQRLTTIYLTLLRLAVECDRAASNKKSDIESRNKAQKMADDIFRTFIFNSRGDYDGKPKIKPTLLDMAQFNSMFAEVSKSRTPILPTEFGEKNGALSSAFALTERKIKERVFKNKQFDTDLATALLSALIDSLKFVQITLGSDDDPHQVFDSLNYQGARLENKDLIRNIVFSISADEPKAAYSMYMGRWMPFERDLGKRLEDYLFPFTLIHKPTATKSSMLSILKEMWKDSTPEKILDDLGVYKKAYNILTAERAEDREIENASPQMQSYLSKLFRMPAPGATFPYLMQVIQKYLDGEISEVWALANIRQFESFLIRRSFAGFEPTGLHRLFKTIYRTTEGDPGRFVDEIDKQYTIVFPSDEKFMQDILTKPLYGKKLAKYIMEEYEMSLVGGDSYISPDGFSIDHIMPQTPTSYWKEVVDSDKAYTELKDTWGNLVPLTLPANSQKGQMRWDELKDYYLTESYFKTTRRVATEYTSWDAATIQGRGEALAAWAITRWPKRVEP